VIAHRAVAADEATLPDLAPQPHGSKTRIGDEPLVQVRRKRLDDARRVRALFVGRRLKSFGEVVSDGLAVNTEAASDLRNREPLAVKIQNHDDFPKGDHRVLPPASGRNIGDLARRPPVPGARDRWATQIWGIFKCHK
jgi:hypothetical protein